MRHLNTLASVGAAVAASVVFVPGAADAALITQTVTLSSLLTDWSARSSTFSLFNTNLGTLTQVDITFKYAASSSITVTNSAITASSGGVKFESALSVAGSSAAMTTAVNAALGAFSNIDPNNVPKEFIIDKLSTNKSYSLAAGGSTVVSNSFGLQTVTGSITAGAELALFGKSGGGTDNFFNDTFTTTVLSNSGGNTGASQVTLGNGSYQIDYTYDVAPPPPPPAPPPPTGTPEPASMALLGMGLVGLGAAVRRRRRT
jgi:hypothetical protein